MVQKIINKLPTLVHFQLKIGSNNEKRFIEEKYLNNEKINNFSSQFTGKQPKIYIVKYEDEIIYVGYTKDSITNRLSYGLAPYNKTETNPEIIPRKNPYAGYKWRHLDKVDYFVWVFEEIELPVTTEMKYLFENIEAEIVFKLKAHGSWPKYQSEIHFYSHIDNQQPEICEYVFGKSLSDMAQEILTELGNYGVDRK
jgi:hypothetical protein